MVWQPGETGNPGGRAKKEEAFPFTVSDIKHHFERWKKLVETGKMTDHVRLHATRQLVEFMVQRMYGKPAQALDIQSDTPLAAVVNITLGSDADPRQIEKALPTQSVAVLEEVRPALLPENQNSQEVETLEISGDQKDPPDWIG